MRPNGDPKRRKSTITRTSSPSRRRAQTTVASASLLDNELLTEEETATFFKDLQISSPDSSANPRSFPYSVKQQCWEKAEKVKGRDPDRWRRDALGNTVFRKLVGCPGCLCHDYDHILPYSKGGQSTLENCQVLQPLLCLFCRTNLAPTAEIAREVYDLLYQFQVVINFGATVNRSKGNRTELSRADLIQKSSYCRVSGRDMDLLELSAYGNVRRGQDSGGCRIQ